MRTSVISHLSGCALRKKQKRERVTFLQAARKADKICFKETNVPIFSAAFLLNSLRSWGIFQGSHRCTPQYARLHGLTTGLCDDLEALVSKRVYVSL